MPRIIAPNLMKWLVKNVGVVAALRAISAAERAVELVATNLPPPPYPKNNFTFSRIGPLHMKQTPVCFRTQVLQ